jgi:hypothetical protein
MTKFKPHAMRGTHLTEVCGEMEVENQQRNAKERGV